MKEQNVYNNGYKDGAHNATLLLMRCANCEYIDIDDEKQFVCTNTRTGWTYTNPIDKGCEYWKNEAI